MYLDHCGMATGLDKMRLIQQQNIQSRRPPQVKYSKNEIYSRVRKIPDSDSANWDVNFWWMYKMGEEQVCLRNPSD
jgi:hypothetical protein